MHTFTQCSNRNKLESSINMNRIIKTAAGSEFSVDFNEKDVEKHFLSKSSYADFILNQINSGIYSRSLKGNNLVIVDLGANIGLFSVYAHDVAKSIYSFEPTPQHFDLLKRMTKTLPNIFPINAAMTDKDGFVPFYTRAANSTMNNVTTKFSGSTEISVRVFH